jgi:hypothetical protein
MFQSVSEDRAAAVWADAENTADPANYCSPLDGEQYLVALFGG